MAGVRFFIDLGAKQGRVGVTWSDAMTVRHPAVEQISAFLSADLCKREAAAVRHHIAHCAGCARIADELKGQTGALFTLAVLDRAEGRNDPPLTLWAAIEAACEWGSSHRPWRAGANANVNAGEAARAQTQTQTSGWSGQSLAFGAAFGALVVAALAFGSGPLLDRLRAGTGDAAGATTTVHAQGPASRQPSPTQPSHAAPPTTLNVGAAPALSDPWLREAETEFARATLAYQSAASRLRAMLDREQAQWDPRQRSRVAERLAGFDEAVAHSHAIVQRAPADGAGAEMLFAAYEKQIEFLAEAVHRGGPSVGEDPL